MVFSSTVFLFLFLPVLLLVYYLPVGRRDPALQRGWRNGVLLLFSIGFHAWGEPVFVFLMLGSVLVNWLLVLLMSRSRRKKPWMVAAIVFDVVLLGVFKYVSFLSRNLAAITGNDAVIVNIALPIGISFFTFQMMSYVFDVYYGKAQMQRNPLYVALYITLFPQLIAGPIVRYTEVAADILGRRESFAEFSQGLQRFIYGLGKKVLLANFLAQIAGNVFDYLEHPSVLMAWIGAVAYTLQIYYDFSGYSDMAIGLGRMFGFHFSENFNYPYIARSVTDFWRRWHISLSTWFRDYVYIPLGGNRVVKQRWVMNLFTVWLLTGIWHGANWTFVLWGLIYFVVLLVEKELHLADKGGLLPRVYTLPVVVLAWVFFRAADIQSGVRYIGHMFGIGANGLWDPSAIQCIKDSYVIWIAAFIGGLPLLSAGFAKLRSRGMIWVEHLWLMVVFLLSLLQVISSTYNPFIYFNF